MTESREFPTPVVLSIVTGRLLVEPFSLVHEAVEWIAGEPVWTHQLPRVSREIEAALLTKHPDLAQAIAEAEQVDHSNWQEWRDRWIERYGATMTIARLTAGQHASKSPIAELVEMAPDKDVIVVEVPR